MQAELNISFWRLFVEADIIVQIVMVMLLLLSIVSWSIIFNKLFALKVLHHRIGRFCKKLNSSASLTDIYQQELGEKDNILGKLFSYAIEELQMAKNNNFKLDANLKSDLQEAMQAQANLLVLEYEKNLGFLATIGSSAPFIGLFGTVWGIMVSFQAIAVSKNTSLAVVAPGIAEALLATALGLVAAIPAVIFYNKFSGDLNKVCTNTDSYITKILYRIFKELKQ